VSQNAYDTMAERALIASALHDFNAAAGAFLSVPPSAYFVPKHEVLTAVMRDMAAKRQTIEAVTVVSEIMDRGLITKVPATYVHKILAGFWQTDNAMEYASRVLELYGRRFLTIGLARHLQALDADWETGEETTTVADTIGQVRTILDEALKYAAGASMAAPVTLAEFLEQEDTYNWLIPGLMERGDRLVLTGEEGFGKSEMTYQMAMCLAGGVHPFLGEVFEEKRVLMIDCENSRQQTRRRTRRIRAAVDQVRVDCGAPAVTWEKNLFLEHRMSGLDLTDGADQAWLENLIAEVGPDLVSVGPLYKLHKGDINSGELARKMLDVIDQLRERHGFAFMSEAHPAKSEGSDGKRKMAPEGSSLFMRWPEFGFGMRRNKEDPQGTADVISWRGQREERDWPATLVRSHGGGLLPWRPDAEYYDQPGVFR
jgi:hypothetical protein